MKKIIAPFCLTLMAFMVSQLNAGIVFAIAIDCDRSVNDAVDFQVAVNDDMQIAQYDACTNLAKKMSRIGRTVTAKSINNFCISIREQTNHTGDFQIQHGYWSVVLANRRRIDSSTNLNLFACMGVGVDPTSPFRAFNNAENDLYDQLEKYHLMDGNDHGHEIDRGQF